MFDKSYASSIAKKASKSYSKSALNVDLDFDLELEAVVVDFDGDETVVYASGKTKAECWADLFLSYPDVSFSMIADYSFV